MLRAGVLLPRAVRASGLAPYVRTQSECFGLRQSALERFGRNLKERQMNVEDHKGCVVEPRNYSSIGW